MAFTNYWWIIIWPFIVGILSYFVNAKKREVIDGEVVVRWKWIFATLYALPFVVWVALRTDRYGDTGIYRSNFKNMPTGLANMLPYLDTRPKGKGFVIFEYLLKTLISRSDIVFFFIVAFIQMYFLVRVYRKYSCDFWLSLFLFVASTDYISWMHNGIRQFLAVTLIFTCIPLIAKKKYFFMVIVILLAAAIHSTALIYLPFIFVINGRAWNSKTLLFILGIIIAVLFVDKVSGFIVESMEDTVYEGDIDIFLRDDGTNILRVLFYAVPTMMSWFFKSFIDKENDPFINICVNLSIISTGIYVFSYFTSGILVGAVPIYFSLTNYILIPWLIKVAFEPASARYITMIFIFAYTFFFYYQCGPTWKLL